MSDKSKDNIENDKLDRYNIKPLYEQLTDKISRDIERGELSYGHKIHSEMEMPEKYAISRMTASKAEII